MILDFKQHLSADLRKELKKKSKGLVKKTVGKSGRVYVTGDRKRLRQSGAYPYKFGKEVAHLYKRGQAPCT